MTKKTTKIISSLGRKFLIVLLAIAMQVCALPKYAHTVNATDPVLHKVEIYRGYGKSAGSEKLAGVLSDSSDTGYSIVGYTQDYTIPASPSPVGNYRYSQSMPKSSDAKGLIKVKSATVYYGDKSVEVTFSTASSSTSAQGKHVNVGDDGSLSVATSAGATTILTFSYKNPTTSADGSLYVKPLKIEADLAVVLHYGSGAEGTGAYEYSFTVNNVDSITDYGKYATTSSSSVVVTVPKFNASTGSIPFTITPKSGKTINSINVDYSNGSYKMTIAKSELATSKTLKNKASKDVVTYNGDNTFNIYKLEANIVVTYNYETDVTFNPNGGKFSDSSVANKSAVTDGYKLAAASIYSGLTKTHETDENIVYAFKGWYDNNTGDYTDAHKITEDYTFTTETATVYAIWDNNYKVTFNPNGGAFTDETTENKDLYTDTTTYSGKVSSLPTVKDTKTVSSKEYYSLEGWYTSATDFTEANLVTADTVFTADTVVYAGWTDEVETVTFIAESATHDTKTVGRGMKVTAPATNPTKPGYSFVGWYADELLTTPFDFTQKITENKNVYARFEETATITVNGAVTVSTVGISTTTPSSIISLDDATDKVIVKKATEINANLTINTGNGVVKQIKVNNTVIAKADLSNTVYIASDYTASASSSATDIMSIALDATNKKINVTLINVSQDTAIDISYDDVTITYKDGTEVIGTDTAPFNTQTTITKPADPTKEGYAFIDWYKESSFTNKFTFTNVTLDGDTEVYAKFNRLNSFEYVYGYGYAVGSAFFSTIFASADGGSAVNTGYSKIGTRPTAYNNTTGDTYQVGGAQTDVDSIDVYYNDGTTIQHINIPHSTSAKNNSIIKCAVYLDGGVLKVANNTNTFPAGATKLFVTAATSDSATGQIKFRCYKLDGNITVVANYYADAKAVTFKNIESLSANETVEEYLIDDSTANQFILEVAKAYSSTTGISLEATPVTGTTVDYIKVTSGDNEAIIAHADLTKTLYLSSGFTFSETAATGDILKYENGKYTIYKVSANIDVEYADAHLITLNAGIGALAATQANPVTTVDGLITKPVLESENVVVATIPYFFSGWYDGADSSTANLIDFTQPFTQDMTIYACWENAPKKNIVINNAFGEDASSAITTTDASKFTDFDGATGNAKVVEGEEEASLTIHAVHGTVNSITVKIGEGSDIALNNTNLFTSADKTVYINTDGTITETKGATCAIAITRNITAKTFDVTYYNVDEDVTMTLNYNKVNVQYVYGENDTEYSSEEIDFNTVATAPTDVTIEGLYFDGWFTSKTYGTAFDFTQPILDDTVVYAKTGVKHTVTVIGAYSSTTTPITSSEWNARVGANTLDAANGIATTKGDFYLNTGAGLTLNTAAGKVKSITFEYDGYTIKLEGTAVTTTTTAYLLNDGTKVGNETDTTKIAVKYAYNTGKTFYSTRFYNIRSDVTITIEYEQVTVTYVDEKDATNVFNIDAKTAGTVADIENRTFTVSSGELKGVNADSVRMAIDPNLSLIKGIKIYETANPSNAEEVILTGVTQSATLTKFGKLAFAYSIASTATDGIIYIRFLSLNKSVTVTPIYYEIEGSHTATIESAADLQVSNEGVPSGVVVSEDGKTITASHGTLGKVTTANTEKESSFRWNLSPTGGSDYEYSKLEIYDADTQTLIMTLDQDDRTGTPFISNSAADADQTCTIMLTDYKVFVKYNKAKNSSAQVRVWALNRNIVLKVYYRDFKNDGSDVAAADVEFPSVSAKVTFISKTADKGHFTAKYDFVTANSVISNTTVDTNNHMSIALDSKELTASNKEQGRTADNAVISGIVRLFILDEKKYATTTVKVYTTGDDAVSYNFTASQTVTNPKLGSIAYVKDGANNYVRFNGIYTDKEIFVEIEQEVLLADGPYTVKVEAENDLGIEYASANPSAIKTSADKRTITVEEGQLLSQASGQSVLWSLASTAGMDFEYSKLEIYELNKSTNKYELIKTIGEELASYKVYGDGEKDQTLSVAINGLSLRYNKSHYGEAQIRVWNVYRNIKLVVYYKNYTTGDVFAANDDAIKVAYDGVVTLNTNGAKVTTEEKNSPITKLNGAYKIRFNGYTTNVQGVKYILTTANEGDRIDYANVTIDGKTYKIGEGLAVYDAVTKNYPGAKITYFRNSDGYAQMRVWAVSTDVSISLSISKGHKHTITFDVGEGGTAKVADIPVSATITDDLKTCVVYEGSTFNSTAGKKTSVRYDVTPKVGYEIDYIVMSVNGYNYRIDNKELESGKTLSTVVGKGASVRYNTDTNGVAQIRMVHVDADTTIKVYYRAENHKVIINTRKLALMRAEGYNTAEITEFTPNYAVATYVPGSTVARQNGVKYWLMPLEEGHKISGAVVENKYGDYLVMGVGFEEKQYEDYKIKGAVIRYYQALDGKIELRIWGVSEDITITIFYDDETPVAGIALPDDIETYDIGEYKEAVDNQVIDVDEPITDEKTDNTAIVIGAVAATTVAATAAYFFIKKKKITVAK